MFGVPASQSKGCTPSLVLLVVDQETTSIGRHLLIGPGIHFTELGVVGEASLIVGEEGAVVGVGVFQAVFLGLPQWLVWTGDYWMIVQAYQGVNGVFCFILAFRYKRNDGARKLTGSTRVAKTLDPVGAHLKDVRRAVLLRAKVLVQHAATKTVLVLENHEIRDGVVGQGLLAWY